jgi:hypothetical protein
MNRLQLLFALSVAVNVGCITLLLLYAASNSGVNDAPSHSYLAEATEADRLPDVQNSAQARSYQRLLSALRATGLDEAQAHRILRGAALADWHEDRLRLRANLSGADEFWNSEAIPFESDLNVQRQLIESRRQKDTILSGLIGQEDSLARWHGRTDLPGLPPETHSAVIMLEEDYHLLRLKVQSRSRLGGVLPEDLVELRLLQAERLQDLASLLSPEELEEYELRNSDTAHRLRQDLIHFRATETEFRHIFRLRRQFEAEFPSGIWAQAHDQAQRMAAEQTMHRQLRQSLGDRRYLDFQRARNPDYQQLAGLAQRLTLPIDRVDAVYDFKTLVEDQELTIQADPDLTDEDRREAMQLLAEEARRTVRESLGDDFYQVYNTHSGWWLHRLDPPLPLPGPLPSN